MTESTFLQMTTMILILRDFKPIIDLDLYSQHMPEERITGSKIGLDLSAGSTYTQVYTVFINVALLSTMESKTLLLYSQDMVRLN